LKLAFDIHDPHWIYTHRNYIMMLFDAYIANTFLIPSIKICSLPDLPTIDTISHDCLCLPRVGSIFLGDFQRHGVKIRYNPTAGAIAVCSNFTPDLSTIGIISHDGLCLSRLQSRPYSWEISSGIVFYHLPHLHHNLRQINLEI